MTASISEHLILAIVTGLIRKGLLDESDIEAMCADLSDEAAHQLRCCVPEAAASAQGDWAAGRARRRLRVIEGGEE